MPPRKARAPTSPGAPTTASTSYPTVLASSLPPTNSRTPGRRASEKLGDWTDASREPPQALCARQRRTSEGLGGTWNKFVRCTDLRLTLRVQFRAPCGVRAGEERVRSAVPVANTTEGAHDPRSSEAGQTIRAECREWTSDSLRTTPVTLGCAARDAEGPRTPTAGRDLPDDGL